MSEAVQKEEASPDAGELPRTTSFSESVDEAARKDLRTALATAVVSVAASVAAVTVDHTVFRVMWLFAALEAAWASGAFFSARRTLLQFFSVLREVVTDLSDVPQREALLARLDERAGAHPNLWQLAVPVVAAVVGAVVYVVGSVIVEFVTS